MHGFQRKEQVGLVLVCLYHSAHIVEVRAGAQCGQHLFNEEHHFRAGRQGVDNMDAPSGIALSAGLLCGARRAVAAREAACDGKGNYVALLAKGILPIRNIGTRAVGAALGITKRADHLVYIEGGIVSEFLRVGSYGKGNGDKVQTLQRQKITAGVCGNAKLSHGKSS